MLDYLPVKAIEELLNLLIIHAISGIFKSHLVLLIIVEDKLLLLGIELLDLHELYSSMVDQLTQVLGTYLINKVEVRSIT
jgi:hypothetical protein